MSVLCRACCEAGRACCAVLVGASSGRSIGLSSSFAGIPLLEVNRTSASSESSETIIAARASLEAIEQHRETLAQFELPPKAAEVLGRLREIVEEFSILLSEQREWEEEFPGGGVVLHRLAAQATGEEDPPDWAGGELLLGRGGFVFKALYEPFVIRSEWRHVLRMQRLMKEERRSPSLGSAEVWLEFRANSGTPVTVLRLSLSSDAAEIFEDLVRQHGIDVVETQAVTKSLANDSHPEIDTTSSSRRGETLSFAVLLDRQLPSADFSLLQNTAICRQSVAQTERTDIRQLLIAEDWPILKCFEDGLEIQSVDSSPWVPSRRMKGCQVRRHRCLQGTPLLVQDFSRTDSKLPAASAPGLSRVTRVYHLIDREDDEAVLMWQTFRDDMPYGDHFQAQKACRFRVCADMAVVVEEYAQVDLVKELPHDLSDADKEVVKYITEQVHRREVGELGSAIGCRLSGQLAPLHDQVGLLGAVVRHLRAAISPDSPDVLFDVYRVPLLVGLEIFAKMLGRLDDSMPQYILSNTRKLRSSKASRTSSKYREWLRAEVEFHAPYKGYADNSAWMANLWIGRTLEFFVELFALLRDGGDTKSCSDKAFQKTLFNHLWALQRMGFQSAMAKLPTRDDFVSRLRADASSADFWQGVDAFVELGRRVAKLCDRMNEELDTLREERRKGR